MNMYLMKTHLQGRRKVRMINILCVMDREPANVPKLLVESQICLRGGGEVAVVGPDEEARA